MFRNYFKTAYRNLVANKVYSIITIAGLGVGIAVCLVIFVFIHYQESYDTFHHNKTRIFRVMTKNTKGELCSCVPFPLANMMKTDFSDLTSSGTYQSYNQQIIIQSRTGQTEKKFKEPDGIFMVDADFFSILDFPWIAGKPADGLKDPDAVVLTKSIAQKYFGDWKQAMGRTLKLNGHRVYKITGIVDDPPTNTDFYRMKILMIYPNARLAQRQDWWSMDSDNGCYVLLPPNVSEDAVNRRLAVAVKKYQTPDNKSTQVLEPLAEAHYDKKAGNYSGKTIPHDQIRNIWLIAAIILVIACVNFINLSTAQAINRAREVGVRKVLGSSRWQLTRQFLLETFLLVLAGVLLAVVLTWLLVTPIGKVLDIPMSFGLIRQGSVLLFLVATLLVVTALAGFYPALVLSSFNPINALKSKLASRNNRGISLRRGLVVFQFVIAQGLIIGTLIVIKQMNYFTHISMGFNKDAVAVVSFPGDSLGISKTPYLRNRLMSLKNVNQVSYNTNAPADMDNWWTDFKFDHRPKGEPFNAIHRWVDTSYLATYSIPLVAGRNFTRTDSIREFIVNETFVHKLGFNNPADVLNKQISMWDNHEVGPIVGVTKDFLQSTLRDSLSAMLMGNEKRRFNTTGIKIGTGDLPATMNEIEKIWNETFPDFVFEYQFLDEKIVGFYKDEAQTSRLYTVFAAIAIFLSCLGLYGLASFMAAQRIKEVGIRKLLGASVQHIIYLFSREFLLLITIAFVLAAPIARYFTHQWLQHFVYRTPVSWWIFFIGGMSTLGIALLTVSFQALKAAMSNPVKNLRTE